MEAFDQLQQAWNTEKIISARASVTRKEMDQSVNARVKKEKRTLVQYFWSTFVYHNMLYALAAFTAIRFHHDMVLVFSCVGGIVFYAPFTALLLRRFKALCVPAVRGAQPGLDIYANLQRQYTLLSDFFRVKKRFDIVAIPLTCAMIVFVIFRIWSVDGVLHHLLAASLLYIVVLAGFGIAVIDENRKRFTGPLAQYKAILDDIKSGSEI